MKVRFKTDHEQIVEQIRWLNDNVGPIELNRAMQYAQRGEGWYIAFQGDFGDHYHVVIDDYNVDEQTRLMFALRWQ